MKSDNEFRRGLMDGIPIGLAYVAVSFAFGISGASHGIPVWALTLISATCVTSAGQFAAIITMTAGGSLVELVLSQIIIQSCRLRSDRKCRRSRHYGIDFRWHLW